MLTKPFLVCDKIPHEFDHFMVKSIGAALFKFFQTMNIHSHTFHIPVMGLGYTLDTPIKVAKYGISSVISIVQDDVIEKARKYYSRINQLPYEPISRKDPDHRHKRITAYLNLVNELVNRSFEELKKDPQELTKMARMLPGNVSAEDLKQNINQFKTGSIDVNIMTKLDRQPSADENVLTEACGALKGYAESDLDSAIVLSAGLNPRLFAFMEQFDDFYPDAKGYLKKRIILKVSDYRSAMVQGKMLAKKGLWISEYRVESGLNCGGHTFASDGFLLGPILSEFQASRDAMFAEQESICRAAWEAQDRVPAVRLEQKLTVQGGLGTAKERELMETYYKVDATGWGSPFLLVPEATSIDDETLTELAQAGEGDIYNSGISPLGVAFSTLRNNSGARVKQARIDAGKPGSPCLRKHLALDPETGLCTASVTYQRKKIKELDAKNLEKESYDEAFARITEKECLCDGLAVSFLKKFDLMDKDNNEGVSICPGPNLAYFDRTYSLEEMVGHIYGKVNVLPQQNRPHMLIKELGLYIDHFGKLQEQLEKEPSPKATRQLTKFRENLLAGIGHYEELVEHLPVEEQLAFKDKLAEYKEGLMLEMQEA